MNDGFHKEAELKLTARTTVRRGDRVRVRGFRGPYTFLALVTPRDRRRKQWVDVIHPKHGGVRSVDVDRITGRY